MRPPETIVERVFEDLCWKPVFFLYQRRLKDRQKLAPQLSWDDFLDTCQEVAHGAGRRLAIEEDNTKNRILTRGAIAEYCAHLAVKSSKTMPFDNALRQSAKIQRCLMVWRGFTRVHPTDIYLHEITKDLMTCRSLDMPSASNVFQKFGSRTYWREGTLLTGDARSEVLRLRTFIRDKCHRKLDNARPLVMGESSS